MSYSYLTLLQTHLETTAAHDFYLKHQALSGIAVGDRVKVLRSAVSFSGGWTNSWTPIMDKAVGQIGKVVDVNDNEISVSFECHDIAYGYPFFVLEKVPEKVSIGMNRGNTAEITPEGVYLGGQKYSFGNIERLAEAVKDYQKARKS